jgi:hypothetical protein
MVVQGPSVDSYTLGWATEKLLDAKYGHPALKNRVHTSNTELAPPKFAVSGVSNVAVNTKVVLIESSLTYEQNTNACLEKSSERVDKMDVDLDRPSCPSSSSPAKPWPRKGTVVQWSARLEQSTGAPFIKHVPLHRAVCRPPKSCIKSSISQGSILNQDLSPSPSYASISELYRADSLKIKLVVPGGLKKILGRKRERRAAFAG